MTTEAPSATTHPAIAAILAISAAATVFLFWLIYVHPAAALSTQFAFLPALNAAFNGLSAMALLIGYTFIRARRIEPHRAARIIWPRQRMWSWRAVTARRAGRD